MRLFILISFLHCPSFVFGQRDLQKPCRDCDLKGSTTIYDLRNNRWLFTDSLDATVETLPASTFKVINLLIALETGVIKDENDTVRWVGSTDTALYGYRPEIYRDMSVRKAFQESAGWVFIELAKKVGKERYQRYLNLRQYGNGNLTEREVDFWNFGAFAISPKNQVQFLVKVYEGKIPFSRRNVEILKRVMITEQTSSFTIRSKTGWTRVEGKDWGWWIGYVEQKDNAYFFATRVTKDRSIKNERFGSCRKEITKEILRQLNVLK
ncbi:MAG TPA: penicillin-binding transpeptidase domain-containing protein [Flavisolibacter sp.]